MEVTSFNQNYFRAIFFKYQEGAVTEHFKDGTFNASAFDEFWEIKYENAFAGNSLNFEIRLKRPDGTPVWKEVFLTPIFKADGSIEEVSGIAKDISDKKKTVKALHQEEEKFKQIFDSFQDLYIRVDLDGKVNMISPSVYHILGYRVEEIMDHDMSNYSLRNVQTKSFLKKIRRVGTLRNIDIELVGKGGNVIPFICNLRVINDKHNSPIAIEWICKDITEINKTKEALLNANENLENSLKIKEQFLANMSHEIRTPMNGIIGLLEMVLDTRLTKKQATYLSTIQQSSKLLLNLLNDILDLSKINAGKLKVNNQTFSIGDLLNDMKTLFASEIEQRKIHFSILVQESVPKYINSDKLRVLQILSNLISNAIKFSSENGAIVVRVFALKGQVIKINVIDTGIGIKKKDVEKLFKNFTQVNESYTKSYKGAGLGLAISKNLAELLNGDIGVDSIYGRGSDFWFTFQANTSTATIKKQPKNKSVSKKELLYIKQKRALVVDDNTTNRMVASEILRTLGSRADEADSAKKAIEMSSKNSYDVILMDIQMPKMDGIEGMKHIKKDNPHQVVIAMTAYDDKNQSRKFIESGFDGYLAKPITPKALVQSISGVVTNNSKSRKSTPVPYNMTLIRNLAKYSDYDTLKYTYNQLEQSLAPKVIKCKAALKNKSYTVISSLVHSLKGDTATLGLEKVATIADRIEKNIEKEQFSSLEEDLKTLYLALAEVPDIIKEILNKLTHE